MADKLWKAYKLVLVHKCRHLYINAVQPTNVKKKQSVRTEKKKLKLIQDMVIVIYNCRSGYKDKGSADDTGTDIVMR